MATIAGPAGAARNSKASCPKAKAEDEDRKESFAQWQGKSRVMSQ